MNGPRKYLMNEIVPIIGTYYIHSSSFVTAQWQISTEDIKFSNKDIKGPELNINNYKFILKLRRAAGGLYFGIWYRGSDKIQETLHRHFSQKYNKRIANKIVESFNHNIKGQESDDILFDLDDANESCILAHIETELMEEELLAHHQIPRMQQDIIDIVGNQISFMVNYDVTINNTIQFRKLDVFNTIQQMQQKVERAINENDSMITMDMELEVFDDEYYADGYQNQEVKQEWEIQAALRDKIMKIKQGEVIYLDNFSLFAIFINKDNGLYNVHLQQYKPNFENALNPMAIYIYDIRFEVNNKQIVKLQDLGMTNSKYILVAAMEYSLVSSILTMGIGIKWH